jgi:hypothetical protein
MTWVELFNRFEKEFIKLAPIVRDPLWDAADPGDQDDQFKAE